MSRRAFVVVDLGFGDSGKGLVTDALVRRHGAHTVVRFNGGAQAGHTVVTEDGRQHTFAQLGAGSFVPGVRTHLAEGMVVHPTGLLAEAAHLARSGVTDALERLSVDGAARVITPFHQAANRLRELARGASRHGTCGVGVGEAVRDALEAGEDAVRMRDLLAPPAVLRRRLVRAQERLRVGLADVLGPLRGVPETEGELAVLEESEVADRWLEAVHPPAWRACITGSDALGAVLARDGAVVFEGAQGVLLDEWHGFHPHTTWTTCTFAPALALLTRHGFAGEALRLGVLRTYLTRHGEGPMPTEAPELAPLLPEPHNTHGPWQGAFRRGWPDFVLWRYALEVAGGADALALTHLDAPARVGSWKACHAYAGVETPPDLVQEAEGRVVRLRSGARGDLAHQARLTEALRGARPVYTPVPAADPGRYPAYVEEALGVPVGLTSCGPRAGDVSGALVR